MKGRGYRTRGRIERGRKESKYTCGDVMNGAHLGLDCEILIESTDNLLSSGPDIFVLTIFSRSLHETLL